ncbi:MAG: taurine dioxygenase [Gammaproteobacteria bacterium]|nr:taurine dioxygenase [Gammaproteobacteria bacterium]|tara:strand:- start:1806 stop:2639 length:834 start_codon:yes stop_codon:yes gene_type:complete
MGELSLRRAAGALGAFVGGVGLADVAASDQLYAQVRHALNEHEVLFFRDQDTAPKVFAKFAKRFGDVLDHPAYATTAQSDAVQILESTAENPSKIEIWHSDMTFMQQPPSFTLLQGQIIPEVGGDTLWASATAAFASLSKEIQDLLTPLTAVHDFAHGFAESLAEPGGAERLAPAIAQNPPVEHPLVRTHPETGAKSIYVNRLFTTRIKQLTALESEHLLNFLYGHVIADEHTVRLSWQPGTVAIWDNRSTQHKPVNDFFPQHRKMHRVTLRGDRPI